MFRDQFFRRFNARRERAQRSNFQASKLAREPRRRLGLSICGPEPLEDRRLLTFAPPVTIPLANVPQGFALGDFYGDGKQDMAIAEGGLNGAAFQIDIFRGNGDGTFQSPTVAATLGNEDYISSLAAADLNHDGKLDLVALLNKQVDVFMGNGDGTFQTPVTYDVAAAISMALGDVTGNGQTDVVLASNDPQDNYSLQVLLANTDGTLQAPVTSTLGQFTTPQNYLFSPNSLALGDFNGDGTLDAVAASYSDQRVMVSMSNGDGTFKAPVIYTTDPIPREAMQQPIGYLGVTGIAVGDFAHDGKIDIAATNYAAKTVSILSGNGDGTFQPAFNYWLGFQSNNIIAADFNGDGNLDLALSDRVGNAVSVMDGHSDGTFQGPVKIATISGPQAMAAGDFNNDGLNDLAVTTVVYNYGIPLTNAVNTVLSLDKSLLPTTFYVDNNLLVTDDRDQSGGLSSGDQVTFGNGQPYQQADLTYDAAPSGGDVGTAFSSINQALASPLVKPGDIIDIAGGTYIEAVTIGESITLQGEGNAVIQAPTSGSGTGITINNNPANVTLADLDVEGFRTGLTSSGIGTLNLTDLTLGAGGSPVAGIDDPLNSLSNVTNLNIVDTSNQSDQIYLNPGPPMGLTPYVQTSHFAITLGNVTNLSITTQAAADTFHVEPIAKTITITGANPQLVPSAENSLDISYPSLTGNLFTEMQTIGAYSGTVNFSGGPVLHFSNIQNVKPGLDARYGPNFAATEGASTGQVLLSQFTDPAGNLTLADYSADINWGDGTTSTGTISFDTAAGIYSVTGNHVYAEDGDELISVVIHRTGSADTTAGASASASEPPITAIGKTLAGMTGLSLEGGQAFLGSIEQPFGGDNESWQATIDWGDGTTSPGTVILPGAQLGGSPIGWNILGSHIYSAAGTYAIQITVTEGGDFESTVNSTAVITGSPLTPNQQFVSHIYSDLLHRAVDQAGLTFWADRLDGGLSRELLVLDLEATPEYRQDEVTSLYEHYLHRAAEPAALAADTPLLAQGMTDEQLAAIIVSSDEYFALHGGTNDGFLTALFQDALNRPIETAALNWFDQYLAAGASRSDVAALIFSSHEYHADVVAGIYEQLLDRQPDARGQQYWAGQLDHGATEEQVIAVIAASDEYFNKA